MSANMRREGSVQLNLSTVFSPPYEHEKSGCGLQGYTMVLEEDGVEISRV